LKIKLEEESRIKQRKKNKVLKRDEGSRFKNRRRIKEEVKDQRRDKGSGFKIRLGSQFRKI